MIRRCLALFALILFCSLAWSQYNEKEILAQQAYQMLAQRQFAEAEKLFGQILEAYPNDPNTVLQLLNIYFQTSQLDKAESLLDQYRRILPQNQATEQEILLLVMRGRPDEAWQLSQTYLQRQNYNDGAYRIVASYFERRGFYDLVLRLYSDARERKGNPELFRLETANAALNYRLFDTALSEYLAFLDKNPGNIYFVNNQCKTILNEDPSLISLIGNIARASQNPVLMELYGGALVSLRQYPEALDVYKSLAPDKLLRFAEEQYNAMTDELALPAFAHLEQLAADPLTANDYRLRQALISYRNGDTASTKAMLEAIIADSLMLERNNMFRKGINLNARKLMAECVLSLTRDTGAAADWYEQARKFCTNAYDTQDIDLSLVRLHLIRKESAEALQKLARVTEPSLRETKDYLMFSLELLDGNLTVADSLMNEFVIRYPAGKLVNDAIYQMMFTIGLQGSGQTAFFDAWRLMLLHDPAAVDSLAAIFSATQDEELLTLAIEWAIMLARQDKALELLDHDWQDPISKEYAALLKLTLTADRETEQRMAREFLKDNPNSIFAPKFRQNLSQMNYSKPEF